MTLLNKNYFKSVLASCILMVFSLSASAQDIAGQTKTMWAKIAPVLDIVVGIGGVIGLLMVFWKFKKGDAEASSQLIMLIGGLFLWYLKGTILGLFNIQLT